MSRPGALPTEREYLERWSRLHGGVDPAGNRLVGLWLRLTYRVARPLARSGASPDLVTGLGVVVAGSVVALCVLGGRWVLLAVVVTVLSGLLDNLDGAVAVLTDRVSAWGAVLDALADRVADGAYLLALVVLGAPGPLAVAAGALMVAQEYARARAGQAGLADVGVVTVAERPTRVIVTAAFLLGAGLHPPAADAWSTAGAAAWTTLGAVGCAQLLVVVRRRLH